MSQPRIVIITGMSGAGKTQVVRTLEDLNYFCVDNLLPPLILKFAELCQQEGNKIKNIALTVDARGGEFLNELTAVLDSMTKAGLKYELLFMDATDATLIKRYKETRRRHPLAGSNGLSGDIAKERELLSAVRAKASRIIDTTHIVNADLRKKIIELYGNTGSKQLMDVVVQSFGFKHGTPMDCDLIFDVRFLPNPYYLPELRPKNGNDAEIIAYIESKPVTAEFVTKLKDFVSFLLPQYVQEGKTQLTIGIGCTGGRHRSVYIANLLGAMILDANYNVQLLHRDVYKV